MTHRRLSICYAAPGQNLVPWAGPTRNVLSVAEALSEWADVTVAFRRIPDSTDATACRVMAIEQRTPASGTLSDDNAARGLHPLQHLNYCRTLRSFARQKAGAFDVLLEKGWRLSGLLSAAFRRQGVPAILVENDVRYWTEPVNDIRQFSKYVLHGLAHVVAGECSRRMPRIIAETDALKTMLVSRRGVAPDRIDVIGLGVNHAMFRPMDQMSSRHGLGIRLEAVVMLYVGAMDEYHDLTPVVGALHRSSAPVELHVIGEGGDRARVEARAIAAGIACRFYGRIPHDVVPQYIAAADICIAPYKAQAFRGGVMTFSTLKIPEYMACARPVASVPSGAVRKLVAHGVSGFVVPNEEASWRAFLDAMPSRERLAAMGAAAARAVQSLTWTATAAGYLETCKRVISDRTTQPAPIAGAESVSR